MRFRLRWVLLGVAAFVAAIVGALAIAFPSAAATTCPGCYGLTRAGDGLYTERGLSEAQRDQLATLAADARRRVEAFYGGRVSDPRLLACFTDGCYDRIGGGGEKGIAILNRAVMLSPRGLDAVIASHEMSHVELHQRLRGGEVPQWFDEGLAVVVSGDPRYLGPRCDVAYDGPLPETLPAWLEAAGADQQVYSRAGCRVQRWLDAGGGRDAVLSLIDHLNSGGTFEGFTVSR
ncbi:hypothetical protein [Paractinoplanes abujensis]|uniref:Peptidase MA superfamily protein n=1 Tax=Paractinoplanes abujensis TaxID=882441 RepID=A0A7W7CSX3_9ACTN|nr:hypothetical protein [Actinoplanes abujensis]MBB4694082.1 hypothetical protein [Actinoplanes abujensis]